MLAITREKQVHDVLLSWVRKKKMDISESFLSEINKSVREESLCNRTLRAFSGSGAGLTKLLGCLLEHSSTEDKRNGVTTQT